MKFKCGLTEEEEITEKEAGTAYWLKVLKEGELWFAWHPIRVKKGDCRWLEKVKRYPTHVAFNSIDEKDTGYYYYFGYKQAAEDLAEGKSVTKYRYEAIQPK